MDTGHKEWGTYDLSLQCSFYRTQSLFLLISSQCGNYCAKYSDECYGK